MPDGQHACSTDGLVDVEVNIHISAGLQCRDVYSFEALIVQLSSLKVQQYFTAYLLVQVI